MHYFQYQAGELYCEEVPLSRIAADMGTPVYVYSERTLERHVRVFDDAFRSVPHLICYAVKANSNINILRRFAEWGTGFDIVSGVELFRVLRATRERKRGFPFERIPTLIRARIRTFQRECRNTNSA